MINIDSNSEGDKTPSKNTQSSKRRQGSQITPQQKKRCTSRSKKTLVVIDSDEESLSLQDDSLSTSKLPFCRKALRNDLVQVNEISGVIDAGSINNSESKNVGNDIPVDPPPCKTARRGLAKRQCQPQTSNNVAVTTHNVSVYSQAITDGFKSLIHGSIRSDELKATEQKTISESTNQEIDIAKSRATDTECSSNDNESSLSEIHCWDENNSSANNSIEFQSPSPPPQSTLKPVVKPMNKQLTKAFNALSRAKVNLDNSTPPDKKSRRRLSDDVMKVGEESGGNRDILVKVRYLTKVHRFHMKLNEPFHLLANKISREVKVDEHSLAFFLHDVSLPLTETANSVKLTVADIIECHCLKASEDSVSLVDAIELVIQCSSSRRKITLTANKRRPLSDIMQKYAELMQDDVNSFVFSFDGEDIEPSDTPSKLGMEDHDVIDVVHN